jgi:hypothetical protein
MWFRVQFGEGVAVLGFGGSDGLATEVGHLGDLDVVVTTPSSAIHTSNPSLISCTFDEKKKKD